MDKKPLLLYFDVPFCPARCRHCANAALEPREDWREAYIKALEREVFSSAGSLPDYEVQAVWVGGGIAGHMFDPAIAQLLRRLPDYFPFASCAEITLKVHPGMVSAATMDACATGRVTRLSVEYLTASVDEHTQLGRFLSPSAMDVTKMVVGNAPLALSFDLLVGAPGQSAGGFEDSLRAAIGYGVEHIALYPLEQKEGTALARDYARDPDAFQCNPRRRIPKPDELAEILDRGGALLRGEGFREYLPHQWARPGRECRFRALEAEGTECLAFGLGAVTTLEGLRSQNTADLSTYLRYSNQPDKIICRVEQI